MACVLLTQLPIIIPSNTVDNGALVVNLAHVLGDNYRVIVTARHISYMDISQRINKCWRWQIRLGAMAQLSIVIVATRE